jgi:D-serine deaminase-like pyridoxal phosphate-dependent protein
VNRDYFEKLTEALRRKKIANPCLIIDRDRLDENLDVLHRGIHEQFQVRISDKSLQCIPLLRHVSDRLRTQRFMSYHLPICERVLEAFPDATTLFGKPLPTEAVRQAITKGFFAGSPNDLDRVTWLADTEKRVEELGQLARSANVNLRVCLETDVGLHRGGFDSPAAMQRALSRLAAWPELSCVGMMGYDAHAIDHPAILGGPGKELVTAQEQFRDYSNTLQHDQREILNTGGSSTVLLYESGHPANDVTVGSAVIKPADFDVPGLVDLAPAAVIAAPVLKVVDVDAPGLSRWSRYFNAIGRLPRRGIYIYGGKWMAVPVYPEGMQHNNFFGESSNQDFLAIPADCTAEVDDFAFFRPSQSEATLQQFGDIAVYSGGDIVDWWPAICPV